MTILCIKLKTGEDIIAKIGTQLLTEDLISGDNPEISKGKVTLSNVLAITIQEMLGPNNQPQMAMALVPFLYGNYNAEMIVDLSDIAMGVYAPQSNVLDNYVRETSPLDLPPTKKIQTL